MNADLQTLTSALVNAAVPVIKNIGELAEQATRGRIVRFFATLLAIRLLTDLNPMIWILARGPRKGQRVVASTDPGTTN